MKQLPEKTNFRMDEVAEYFSVSPTTIRREIEEGHIKAVKIRGQWRIPRTAILEYQNEHSTQSSL